MHSSLISRYLDAALRAARHAGLVVIVRLGSTGFAAILDTGLAAVLGGARADATSRKHAKGPSQKYQNEDEPVPMLILVPVHLGTGTFGVDGTYG